MKGITLKICMLRFVLINSVLLNLLCVDLVQIEKIMTRGKFMVILLLLIFVVFLPSFQTPMVQAHEFSPLQDLHLNTLHGLSWCGQDQHYLTGCVWRHDAQEWERLCQDGEWEKTGWLSMRRGYRLFDEYEILLLHLFFFLLSSPYFKVIYKRVWKK